ncbi:MAG TPA: hypothetical protein DCY97_05910 [Marinilabiliales bacterium]|nr:hypothetical protein [Marinilabiliales bacterium]
MCRKKLLIIFLIINVSLLSNAATQVKADRWLEIDLYWFERTDIDKSVQQFWERFYPLMEGVEGWRGVIMNVGWISDYILEWDGNLSGKIKLPKNMKKWPWFEDMGQFCGNTQERIQMFNDRFGKADLPQVINYEDWTYADLKKLIYKLKYTAFKKYGMNDIKIGTFVLGWQNIYGGDKTEFVKLHQNAYIRNFPNMEARFSADSRKYGAYPSGIPEGLTFTKFFGEQWGNLSKIIGLDAIVLRDSYLGVGIYSRVGPYGKTAPNDPEKVANWSRATADLVRYTKLANPKTLVIGYSNAASAVADWRVNCIDLEIIAKEGYLDGWIDQTWAGAWNEVGQRPNNFWNSPDKGWTYQLAYMLGHAAVLAESKVHHYFLTETFDAWESWDVIHNARERLRWGIWAYSHAAVKMPGKLKMPTGSYISWCNQGKTLLSKEDVLFIAKQSNAAFNDAHETKRIFGPTIVYCRSAMEWQSANKPETSIKEWIDEQAGTLMKWSVPICSITRSEYLSEVESDMFIFQTPVHLKLIEKENIIKVLKSGKPAVVIASPAGGLDKDISDLLGVSTADTAISSTRFIGTTNFQTENIFDAMPNSFPVFQPFTNNNFTEAMEVIYSIGNSPCLGYNQQEGKQLIFWDPPEFDPQLSFGKDNQSLDLLLGSPVPYVLTARLVNKVMEKTGLAYVDKIHQYWPVNFSFWELNDGSINVMAGNLEEGINHTCERAVHVVLNFPQQLKQGKSNQVTEVWGGEKTIQSSRKIDIYLEQAQTKLFRFRPND